MTAPIRSTALAMLLCRPHAASSTPRYTYDSKLVPEPLILRPGGAAVLSSRTPQRC